MKGTLILSSFPVYLCKLYLPHMFIQRIQALLRGCLSGRSEAFTVFIDWQHAEIDIKSIHSLSVGRLIRQIFTEWLVYDIKCSRLQGFKDQTSELGAEYQGQVNRFCLVIRSFLHRFSFLNIITFHLPLNILEETEQSKPGNCTECLLLPREECLPVCCPKSVHKRENLKHSLDHSLSGVCLPRTGRANQERFDVTHVHL